MVDRNASSIGPGTLGLCLTNLLLLETLIEPNLEAATGAQFEFIALSRIHEYMGVPQEKDMRSRMSWSRFFAHIFIDIYLGRKIHWVKVELCRHALMITDGRFC